MAKTDPTSPYAQALAKLKAEGRAEMTFPYDLTESYVQQLVMEFTEDVGKSVGAIASGKQLTLTVRE